MRGGHAAADPGLDICDEPPHSPRAEGDRPRERPVPNLSVDGASRQTGSLKYGWQPNDRHDGILRKSLDARRIQRQERRRKTSAGWHTHVPADTT